MPYDNNLVQFGEPIIEMIARGTQHSDAVVAIQSDYRGDLTMRRRQIIHGKINELDVAGEDSSDVSAFSSFLDWAYQNFEVEHWAVIIVGHGGKINEISPDDHAINLQERTWMRVDELARAVNNFNQLTDGRVELLFFQNCNKASLEVIYEAKDCARYTLASQLNLGAPNYYYQGFLKRLNDSSVSGREAAIAITEYERADMYHSLTLFDNQAVTTIPEKLARVLQPVFDKHLPVPMTLNVPTYSYFGEECCDLITLLNALLGQHETYRMRLIEFTTFLKSSVIAYYKTGGELYNSRLYDSHKWDDLSGLGIHLPANRQALSSNESMALYQTIDLSTLYEMLWNSTATP